MKTKKKTSKKTRVTKLRISDDEALYLYDVLNLFLFERSKFMHHTVRKALKKLKERFAKVALPAELA